MDSEITKIILEAIIGVVAVLITGYLLPWFKSMVGEEKFALIVDCTAYAVRAAEQLFTPEQWQEKKAYVLKYVTDKAQEIGLALSEADIENLIEGLVNEIKKG